MCDCVSMKNQTLYVLRERKTKREVERDRKATRKGYFVVVELSIRVAVVSPVQLLASAVACLRAAAVACPGVASACLRASACWAVDRAVAAQEQTLATCPAGLGQLVSALCLVAHDPTDSLPAPAAVAEQIQQLSKYSS